MELLFTDDAYLKECQAKVVSSDLDGIRLNRTVFYPAGGGQPGDVGHFVLEDGSKLQIIDTRKGNDHLDVVHIPAEGAELPSPGDAVTAVLDKKYSSRSIA